jgi:DNA-binding MarR family transcriptional regulator
MQETATVDAVGDALLIASRALVGIAARSLADIGDVTLPQYRALVVVAGRDDVTVNDLAAALDIHGSTATRLCDRLVQKRLLRRTRTAEDRRVTHLRLTAGGARLVDRVSQRRRQDLVQIAQRLSASDRDALLVGLGAFREAAEEPALVDLLGWAAEQR